MTKLFANPRAFTLVEMLIAITILGIIASTTLIKVDLFGTDADQEFRQMISFLRLQHARTLRTNSSISVELDPSNEAISVIQEDGDSKRVFQLERLAMQQPRQKKRIRLSPWNFEPYRFVVEHPDGNELTIRTSWTLGFESGSND